METVSVTIRVNGRKLPAKHPFPFRSYSQTVELPADVAEAMVDAFRASAKSKVTTEKPFFDDDGNPAKPPF